MKFWNFDNYDVVKDEDTNIYIVLDRYLRDKASVLDNAPIPSVEDVCGMAVKLVDIDSIQIESHCDIDCLVNCCERFDKFEKSDNKGTIIAAYKYNCNDKKAFIGVSFNDILMMKFDSKKTIDSMIILIEFDIHGSTHISPYIINSSRGVPFDLVSIDNELFLRIGKDIVNIKDATTASDKLDKEYEVLQ